MIWKSSIGRKFAMALSALFLLVFLLQHFVINFLSVISPEAFNATSHFMGTNPLVQFLLQPILLFGVLFHFVMGFALEIQNRKARPVKYAMNKPGNNASWMSRNMIYSGLAILLFLGLHMYDFWWHEMNVKYIAPLPEDPSRYYGETIEKFHDIWRVLIYIAAFVFLSLHLMHGFQSAFQSAGANHRRYTPGIKKVGKIYAYAVPVGFIFIALFHFLNQ